MTTRANNILESLADTSSSSAARPLSGYEICRTAERMLRIVFGCALLWSAISKLQNPYAFLATLDQYELVGPRAALIVAILLPFLELVVATCLIGGIALRATWVLVILLFTVFAGALASVAYRGLHTTCGCFGPLETSDVTWATVARTFGFLAAALAGISLHSYIAKQFQKHSSASR